MSASMTCTCGLASCGCCMGLAPATPREVNNRAGLAQVAYRIGAYPQFKASLLAGLSSSKWPALTGLRTRDSADFSIALLDAAACAADVLTFYQERLAQESYLRTATERVSLQEMGKLIGYKLRPGAAAETWLAFALEAQRLPPATLSPDPGSFVTGIPAQLTLPVGLKVQSVPGPDERPQIFQTVAAIEARAEWNAMRVLPDEDVVPGFGATSAWLAGVDTQLQPGDKLLFVGAEFAADPNSDRWDLRTLVEVQPDAAARRTRVAWAEPLGSVAPASSTAAAPTVYALKAKAAVFGHNAPDWGGMNDDFKAAYLGLENKDQLSQAQRLEWPQFDIHGPALSGNGLHVQAVVSAQKAADALAAGLKADAAALARKGLASVGGLAASASALLEKAAALPGEIGKTAFDAVQHLPDAVGVVAERVMEPVKWLVVNGIVPMQSWITGAAGGLGSTAGAVGAIAGFLNGLPGIGQVFGGGGTVPGAPPFAALPANMWNPIFDRQSLDDFKNVLGPAVNQLGNELNDLAERGKNLRTANAAVLEAALANAAGAVYTALMQAELEVSPRLPYASADSVCSAAADLSAEARDKIPALVVAAALSDPRPGALLLLALAPMDDTDRQRELTVLGEELARMAALVQVRIANILQPTLQAGQLPPSPLDMGGGARALLLPIVAGVVGNAATAFHRSVARMMKAAASGIAEADRALLERIERLKLTPPARIFGGHDTATVSLERVFDGLLAGSHAVLKSPRYTELFRITALREVSRAEFAVAGKSTVLTLAGENLPLFAGSVRELTVLAQSKALARARTPITRVVRGNVVEVAGRVEGLQPGRRLLVQGRDALNGELVAHAATLVTATLRPDRTLLALEPPLARALMREGSLVFGNVAPATHGETGAQILGAGDAGRPHQRFDLKRLPLTWRSAANERGVDAELTVRVDDIAWQRRDTLYGAGPGERLYALASDESGRDWVQFGDGVNGARPASGNNNIRASYRQGLGLEGNVPAGRLTQLMSRPPGLKGVANPAAALGGSDPESAEQARRSMPLGTRTLGRTVSVRDYEDYALAFNGIAKAQAAVLELAEGPTVVVTIAGPAGEVLGEDHPVRLRLLSALRQTGDPHVRLLLLDHRAASFRIALKVRPDPAFEAARVLAAVDAALRLHFGFDARALGQAVLHSEIAAVAHAVPGVVAIDVDALYGGSWPGQGTPGNRPRLLARAMQAAGGQAQAAELLTLASGPLDRLETM